MGARGWILAVRAARGSPLYSAGREELEFKTGFYPKRFALCADNNQASTVDALSSGVSTVVAVLFNVGWASGGACSPVTSQGVYVRVSLWNYVQKVLP